MTTHKLKEKGGFDPALFPFPLPHVASPRTGDLFELARIRIANLETLVFVDEGAVLLDEVNVSVFGERGDDSVG